MPRNCHFRQISQSAIYLQNCSSCYSPDSSTPQQRLLFNGKFTQRTKAHWEKHEEFTDMRKDELREDLTTLDEKWAKPEKEWQRELADAPNNSTQFRHAQTHKYSCITPLQMPRCLMHSVQFIVKCWEGPVILQPWKTRCVFYAVISGLHSQDLCYSIVIFLSPLNNFHL